jgi:hypothetical protein
MTASEFRRLALSFPGTTESVPHGASEFCVRTRNFAGLAYPEGERAAVKLTPAEQAKYMAAEPHAFLAKGERGKRGWTIVHLADANDTMLRVAILAAWRNAATKQLLKEYDEERDEGGSAMPDP